MILKRKSGNAKYQFSQSYGFSNKPTLSKLPLMNASQVLNLEQELVDKRMITDPAGVTSYLPASISQGMELMFQEKKRTNFCGTKSFSKYFKRTQYI